MSELGLDEVSVPGVASCRHRAGLLELPCRSLGLVRETTYTFPCAKRVRGRTVCGCGVDDAAAESIGAAGSTGSTGIDL